MDGSSHDRWAHLQWRVWQLVDEHGILTAIFPFSIFLFPYGGRVVLSISAVGRPLDFHFSDFGFSLIQEYIIIDIFHVYKFLSHI